MLKGILCAALAIGAAGSAAAAPAAMDARQPPWLAIAKVNTNTGTRCSGALVGPTQVLTAAHCLYNRRTERMLPAGSLHVLLGYDRGEYSRHLAVKDYALSPAYDAKQPKAALAADWAILFLTEPVAGIAPLRLGDGATAGPAGLVGYRQDKAHVLYGDLACAVIGRVGGMVQHDCSSVAGLSGGPLLQRSGGEWRVVGVNVAMSAEKALAVPVCAFARSVDAKAAPTGSAPGDCPKAQ